MTLQPNHNWWTFPETKPAFHWSSVRQWDSDAVDFSLEPMVNSKPPGPKSATIGWLTQNKQQLCLAYRNNPCAFRNKSLTEKKLPMRSILVQWNYSPVISFMDC